jgi:hypothetical protein
LWEPLSQAAVRGAERKVGGSGNAVFVVVLVAAGAVCLALLAVSAEAAAVGMCVILLGALVHGAVAAWFRGGEEPAWRIDERDHQSDD